MSMKKEQIAYLDSLSDSEFIFFIWNHYGTYVPQWKRISKKEYEKNCGKADSVITISKIEKCFKNLFAGKEYRMVPYYKNGGGVLDRISGKKPDGYYYEKCTGYNKVLQLGSDLFEYCQTRECMKPYFKQNRYESKKQTYR